MNSFDFCAPTKIYFGDNRHKEIGKIITEYNFKKILLIYGKGSIKVNNTYNEILTSLKENNIEFVEVSGVEANPKLSFVKKVIENLKGNHFDLILAIGGGSVIDTAKSISHSFYYDGNPFDFNIKKALPSKLIPIGVILTISAAGSELSDSCVISNDETSPFIKKGFNSPTNRPLFAILNPRLTFTVNKFQTGCGIVDTLMHTLERYMNPNDSCELSENIAIGLLKTVLHYGKIAIENPTDYQARAELMLASSLSHNGLTGLGKTQFMRVHGLEHILSGCHDEVAHGEGLAILWPAWCLKALENPKAEYLLKKLAKELFNLNDAKEGIIALKNYFKEIGMKTSLSELKLTESLDIEKMALIYSNNKTSEITTDFIKLNYDSFIDIFKLAE